MSPQCLLRSKSTWERAWWHLYGDTLGCVIVAPLQTFVFLHKIRGGGQLLHTHYNSLVKGSCQYHIYFAFFLLICFIVLSYSHEFLLTQRSRSSGPFRYIKHVRKVRRKFSRTLWKESFSSKHGALSKYSYLILSFIFQKISTYFTFPDIYSDWCVVRSHFFTDAKNKVNRTS